jgi:hypothetical protein
MKPSRPCWALPSKRSPVFGTGDHARWDSRPRSDPKRRERIDLIARVLVAYVAEDPFGPRPLPPLLDRVRNALDTFEPIHRADHGPPGCRLGASGGVPVSLDRTESRQEAIDRPRGKEGSDRSRMRHVPRSNRSSDGPSRGCRYRPNAMGLGDLSRSTPSADPSIASGISRARGGGASGLEGGRRGRSQASRAGRR